MERISAAGILLDSIVFLISINVDITSCRFAKTVAVGVIHADSDRLPVVIALFLWLARQPGTASEAVYVTHIFGIDNFSPVYLAA